jgi:hypothetical protein
VIGYRDGWVSISGVGYDIACVDGETEFLSPTGWVRMDAWSGEDVAQYDPATGVANFVRPLAYVAKPAKTFLRIKTKFGRNSPCKGSPSGCNRLHQGNIAI